MLTYKVFCAVLFTVFGKANVNIRPLAHVSKLFGRKYVAYVYIAGENVARFTFAPHGNFNVGMPKGLIVGGSGKGFKVGNIGFTRIGKAQFTAACRKVKKQG